MSSIESLAEQIERVHQIALAKKQTIATAESCTGGLLGASLTQYPGSSSYYLGGFIAYANQAKVDLLGVSQETLDINGAVSHDTAVEMARGARIRLGADLAVSVTGIAGPSGGSSSKPVGTIWLGAATEKVTTAVKLQLNGSREEIRQQTVARVFSLIERFYTMGELGLD